MALSKKDIEDKARMNGALKAHVAFLYAMHGTTQKEVAQFLGEDPGTFQVCLTKNKYSKDKLEEILKKLNPVT